MPFVPRVERSSNFEEPSSNYKRDILPGYEEVYASEWRAKRGKLFTKYAEDCIVLAAINIASRTSLIDHLFPDDFETDPDFVDSTIDAIPLLGSPEATKIALAGGGIGIHEGAHLKRRERIETRVAQIALQHAIPEASIKGLWLEDPPEHFDQWVDVFADPEAGHITVRETLQEVKLEGKAIINTTTH